jgi:hypothetical protein
MASSIRLRPPCGLRQEEARTVLTIEPGEAETLEGDVMLSGTYYVTEVGCQASGGSRLPCLV